uniref:Uncharacterized protein n=1 Tax=Octopus bimaculoides TaxID=37653 RepID=A0A0L8HFU1_OCTBM
MIQHVDGLDVSMNLLVMLVLKCDNIMLNNCDSITLEQLQDCYKMSVSWHAFVAEVIRWNKWGFFFLQCTDQHCGCNDSCLVCTGQHSSLLVFVEPMKEPLCDHSVC